MPVLLRWADKPSRTRPETKCESSRLVSNVASLLEFYSFPRQFNWKAVGFKIIDYIKNLTCIEMNRCINNNKWVNIVFSSIDVIIYSGKFPNSVDLLTEWEGKMGKYVTQVCRPSATKSACYDCGPNIVQYDTIKLIH